MAKKIQVAEVKRYGDALVLPEAMDTPAAIAILQAKMREEEEYTIISRTFPVNPYDGAYILALAIEQLFGMSVLTGAQGFWGRETRQKLQLVVDHTGKTVDVPWGAFQVPGVEGEIETTYERDGARVLAKASANVKGKYAPRINALFDLTTELCKTKSIYKGKAMQMRFTDESGSQLVMPDIKFIDLSKSPEPIFAKNVEEKLLHDLYAYITLPQEVVLDLAGSLTRGVLLAGPFGSGKTMLSGRVGKIAVEHNFTFVYVQPQDAIAAIQFANQYGPAVLFIEDLDKLNEAAQRNLMNALDGITSKNMRVVSIFTTNFHEKLIQGLVRNGRIDLALHIDYPDADAAIRIAGMYANGHMDRDDDFSGAGAKLAGNNPATIKEIVNRAKFRAASRDGADFKVNNIDLANAADSVLEEREFLTGTKQTEKSAAEMLAESLAEALSGPIAKATDAAVTATLRKAGLRI